MSVREICNSLYQKYRSHKESDLEKNRIKVCHREICNSLYQTSKDTRASRGTLLCARVPASRAPLQ